MKPKKRRLSLEGALLKCRVPPAYFAIITLGLSTSALLCYDGSANRNSNGVLEVFMHFGPNRSLLVVYAHRDDGFVRTNACRVQRSSGVVESTCNRSVGGSLRRAGRLLRSATAVVVRYSGI